MKTGSTKMPGKKNKNNANENNDYDIADNGLYGG